MLPRYIRFQAVNSTGVTFGAADTLTLTGIFKKLVSATGIITDAALVTPLAASSGNSLGSGAYATSAAIDTSALDGAATGTSQGLQFDGLLEASISTATPAGSITVRMQASPDNAKWPANGAGAFVGQMTCTATGAQPNTRITAVE